MGPQASGPGVVEKRPVRMLETNRDARCQDVCSGTMAHPQRTASRDGGRVNAFTLGHSSNVSYYDGHAASASWTDLENNVDDVWSHETQ